MVKINNYHMTRLKLMPDESLQVHDLDRNIAHTITRNKMSELDGEGVSVLININPSYLKPI
jgi:hypothetical protein